MFTLDSGSTAVLVVDMQNDNLHEGGAFAGTGRRRTRSSRVSSPT